MLPDDVPPPFPSTKVQAVARLVELDRAAAEALDALGPPPEGGLLLKGPSFARWLYSDDPRARRYSDVDVLAAPTADSADVLRSLGYVHTDDHPLGVHSSWVRDRDNVTIELHSTLVGIDADPSRVWRSLSAHSEEFAIAGSKVAIFDEVARAFHASLHLAGDTSIPQPREDLERALSVTSDAVWREAAALADSLDAMDAFVTGLMSTHRGLEVTDRLGLPKPSSLGVELRARTAPDAAQVLGRIDDAQGLRAKVAIVREILKGRSSLSAANKALRALPHYWKVRREMRKRS